MITLKRLQQVKVMITQQDVYQIILISKIYYELIAIDLSKQQKTNARNQFYWRPKQSRDVKFLNVKLSNSQLNKLKSAMKYETEVTFNFSLNLKGNSNDQTNFPH